MNDTTDPRCFYCDRTGQQLETCCERHPGDLVCADRAGCRDFILAALKAARPGSLFTIGQLVTVTDGGWTGTVERIDADLGAAWVRFPDRPDLLPYAFEALGRASCG